MRERLEMLKALAAADVYPVIGEEFCGGRSPLEILRAAGKAGARIVQLREKSKSKREVYALAVEFRKICSELGVLMIVNDHLDLALSCGADGVHLGQDDLPLEAARRIAPDLILGVSTHSTEQALTAQRQGADYINLGPIYPTSTKATPVKPLGVELISATAPLLEIPFSVMGGIKAGHIRTLREAGARMVAMVTEISMAEDVETKVRELRALWGARD